MKKTLLIILSISLFVAFSIVAYAGTTIVKSYPELPACENKDCKPGDEGFGLPQFIKYLFLFALGAVGLAALLAIIIGGFGYLTAVGNPQKASEAKNRIFAALLGILLLLGSYIILNTINPDLLKLGVKLDPVESELKEIKSNYVCYYCCGSDSTCQPYTKLEFLHNVLQNVTKTRAQSICAENAGVICRTSCELVGCKTFIKVIDAGEHYNESILTIFKNESSSKNEAQCKKSSRETVNPNIDPPIEFCKEHPNNPTCPYRIYCSDTEICKKCWCEQNIGQGTEHQWVLNGNCRTSQIR